MARCRCGKELLPVVFPRTVSWAEQEERREGIYRAWYGLCMRCFENMICGPLPA